FYTAESLVERGELSLEGPKRFFGRVAENGKFYAPYGPLCSVVSAPFYGVGTFLAESLNAPEQQKENIRWVATAFSNTTIAAAAVAVFFLLARRLGAERKAALIASLVFGLCTPIWHYATTYFSESLSAFLVVLAAERVAAHRQSTDWKMWLAVSIPVALLCLARMTQALVYPLFVIAAFLFAWTAIQRKQGGGRSIRSVLPGALRCTTAYTVLPALTLAGYCLWNYIRFGDPLQPGYPATIDGRAFDAFDESFLRGLYGLTLSPGKGLFLFAAPTLVGLFAARRFVKTNGLGIAAWLAIPLAPLLFFATYTYWEGGYCWGPRFLLPTLAFWILPLALHPPCTRFGQVALAGTAATSFALGALGTSVSFLECQVKNGYYTSEFRYLPEYSAVGESLKTFTHYANEAFAGRFLTEESGVGFDFWFFFLSKEGVATGTLVMSVSALVIGLAASACWVSRELRGNDETSAKEPESVREAELTTT
ncbi:MAG: hypothetical protein AAF517_16535, partial [Planctomycetota bacterium]